MQRNFFQGGQAHIIMFSPPAQWKMSTIISYTLNNNCLRLQGTCEANSRRSGPFEISWTFPGGPERSADPKMQNQVKFISRPLVLRA